MSPITVTHSVSLFQWKKSITILSYIKYNDALSCVNYTNVLFIYIASCIYYNSVRQQLIFPADNRTGLCPGWECNIKEAREGLLIPGLENQHGEWRRCHVPSGFFGMKCHHGEPRNEV